MADVGKKTGKQTQAGRDVYETPEGEMVSEKSTTFEYKGKWINIPTIHGGTQYSEDELVELLNEGLIKPTSTHDELEDALQAAEERSESLEFNKGGTPMMEEQMELFEEGGLKEEGGMVDEESGNDVPIGSTKEEVRDDIPAMLSEGEFVFPADVVRYHGLERLMELRQEAKMGLKKMEAMGQMGNADEATLPDDIPFTVDDLIIISEPMEMEEPEKKAHGGVLHAAQGTFVPASPQQKISTGVIGNQQSMYAGTNAGMPNVNSNVGYTPASSVIPTNPNIGINTNPNIGMPTPAPATGFSPLYQPTPTPTVAPKFEADAVEFTGVDPDKYTDPTKIANEAVGSTGTTNVATTQTMQQAPAEDDGDKDMIRQLKDTADRERAQAAYEQKQADLKDGSADTLVERWLDNKRVLGAGQTLFGLSPVIGGLTTAAGYRDQKQLEEALDKRFPDWRDGKGLSEKVAKDLKDYSEAGFFRNTKAFGNKLFEDAKAAVTGFSANFTKEGQTKFYKDYASRGPKYDISDNPYSGGGNIKGFEATGKINETTGLPQSSGMLSIKEQQSYDNAVANGDAATANHHAIIARHRAGQNAYAAAMKEYEKTGSAAALASAEALGKNMSSASKKQAIRFGGSVHSAVENGTAKKQSSSGTQIFSKYVPNKESSNNNDSNKSSSNTGGYSCYVATALNDKGYWPTIKKIKLIKWCMDAKPENKFDTKLWRNGYTVFGKTVIAPHVDNKIIQWLSDGFYNSRVKNKKDVKSLIGLLFFYIPSYTIALYKMLRNDLVDIERT